MVWIIGEYAERIENADELLESFIDGFHDENTQVQLQLLTAVVKLFLKRPSDSQELVQRVLSLATQVRRVFCFDFGGIECFCECFMSYFSFSTGQRQSRPARSWLHLLASAVRRSGRRKAGLGHGK